MNKKIWAAGLLGAMLWGLPLAGMPAEAADVTAAQQAVQQGNQAEAYTYTSSDYGYSILCPIKPNVIPADVLYEGAKGEVLIFANEEYNIKLAWVVLVDAFDDKAIPDFNKLTEEEAKVYLDKIRNKYHDVGIENISEHNKALFAITAKELEIDTTGDGKPDTVATMDTQAMLVFFRTPKGGRYQIQLIDNPVLRPESMGDCRMGISTFREVDANAGAKPVKK